MSEQKKYVVHTPLFPAYSEVKELINILAKGSSKQEFLGFRNAIWELTGTPQNPVDWSSPDDWIEQRLQGKIKALAHRIWAESKKSLNPRYVYGAYLFINRNGLLATDQDGNYLISAAGAAFLKDDAKKLRELDEDEGLPKLLAILASHSPAKRGDLLGEWGEFLLANSKFGTASTINDTLRRRLQNLVERGFVSREGNVYSITAKGIEYAAESQDPETIRPFQQVMTAVKDFSDASAKELRQRLEKMNPYRFEVLVKDLLEAMDYEDVKVTKASGDKGIDVVGHFQFGITQIKEVVQVKRHQASITRPVLDQLRGVLPLHGALRGTIITIGKFAQGCKDVAFFPGAAPITLIDGDKLIELLLKYEIGIKKKALTLVEIDEDYLAAVDPESAIANSDDVSAGIPQE